VTLLTVGFVKGIVEHLDATRSGWPPTVLVF